MSRLSQADLLQLAAAANQAPSVHNTQPTRWKLADDGALWLLTDTTRQLAVGDVTGRDLRVSLGATLEASAIVLAEHGIGFGSVSYSNLRAAVRIELTTGAEGDPLVVQMPHRVTWRKGFARASWENARALVAWSERHEDITRVDAPEEINLISALNERTSLAFYRNAAYRNELLYWMRLSPDDPRFGIDGLSAPALGMSGFEAFGAGHVLRDPLFGLLDRTGVIGSLISEHRRTMSATAILLFHRPIEENPIDTGRALYRRQLELSARGFQTWPMSVLADDADAAAEIGAHYGLADDRRLITAWRTGLVPAGQWLKRERLPAAALIATS
ncbi:hypothetical protein ABIB57_004154 [Devosia sp. UYZn731]|uniref:hypothetical protein n=1 Tax=Devosia sp. UYZn731 TaxID=3156345 RepID=UPI003394BD4F